MPRILILTAGYGEGHNSAARAVHAALRSQPDVDAEIIDLFALCSPRINALSRRGYVRLINGAPRVWSGFFQWLDRSPRAPLMIRALRGHHRRLAAILAERRPDALVSTYPVYAWMLDNLRREGFAVPPLHTVVTDALTINSLWYRVPSAAWYVTDTDSAAALHRAGIPPERVRVSGFPVAPAFADRPADLQPPDPAAPGQPRRVLYMINSGRSRALETATALLSQPDWHITFTAGRDEGLKQELQVLARRSAARCEILGWTDRIPELLMTHHVVISKAGGATTQESINALCPMIVNQVVPGQEEGNCQLLLRHDAGALAETPGAVLATLQDAFADDASRWRRWRQNLRRIAHPEAARTVARAVLDAAPAESLVAT
jgi:processive 1,2-diacylglycerol beta-glucosyltransferase